MTWRAVHVSCPRLVVKRRFTIVVAAPEQRRQPQQPLLDLPNPRHPRAARQGRGYDGSDTSSATMSPSLYDEVHEAVDEIDGYRSISIDVYPAVIGRKVKGISSTNRSNVNVD